MECEKPPSRPLSPASKNYVKKRKLLMEKYKSIRLSNDRLKNRLYHVKKEIKHLKQLKRILCQQLLIYGDRFMDSFLEIPDNEPGSNVVDKIIADVASIPFTSRRPQRTDELRSMTSAAKIRLSSIIDSVVTELHDERIAKKPKVVDINDHEDGAFISINESIDNRNEELRSQQSCSLDCNKPSVQ